MLLTLATSLAEQRDGAQTDVDIIAHLISLFKASKQQKEERLASIEAEVSKTEVQQQAFAYETIARACVNP